MIAPSVAAQMLRVSKRSVITWCQRGTFPGAITDRRGNWSIPVAEVEKVRVTRRDIEAKVDVAIGSNLAAKEYADDAIAVTADVLVAKCRQVVEAGVALAAVKNARSIDEIGERADRMIELYGLIDALGKQVDEWRFTRRFGAHVDSALAELAQSAHHMKRPTPAPARKARQAKRAR
jgi:hypothetical protein